MPPIANLFSRLFHEAQGMTWWLSVLGAFLFTFVVIVLLQLVPQRFRRHVILGATFVGGLFYAVEFFWPTHLHPTPADPKHQENFLTPFVVPFGSITPIIAGWTVGLGVINLLMVHGKRLTRRPEGWGNSLAFLISMILMTVVGILANAHRNAINVNLNRLLFEGALQSLDSTMFSIIAFYIVSAAYRAFRVRSTEATMLLITAVLVMLGQIAVGQLLTSQLPHNLHIEVIRDWMLTKANAAAVRAIGFGLGIGSLAVALRIWLGLERGSYFDR
jgi:hypothetical protein